jgi:hypothetical protein
MAKVIYKIAVSSHLRRLSFNQSVFGTLRVARSNYLTFELPLECRARFVLRTSFNYSVIRASDSAGVGQERFELSTPRLSSVCSNQLSYWPNAIGPSRPNSGASKVSIDRNGLELEAQVITPERR